MISHNNAVSRLTDWMRHDSKQLVVNQKELEALAGAYFRYQDLLRDQEERKQRVLKIFGVLGCFAPHVPEEAVKIIEQGHGPIGSDRVFKDLKLWEVLELYLSCAGEAGVGHFRGFLITVDAPQKPSSQAVVSAVKTHPDLFEEVDRGREKLIKLRKPSK